MKQLLMQGISGHMGPAELRRRVQNDQSPEMRNRRAITIVSLLGIASMAIVTLKQTGIVKHLPDPPVKKPHFDSDKVNSTRKPMATACRTDRSRSRHMPPEAWQSPRPVRRTATNVEAGSRCSPRRSHCRRPRLPPNTFSIRCPGWTRLGAPIASPMHWCTSRRSASPFPKRRGPWPSLTPDKHERPSRVRIADIAEPPSDTSQFRQR